MRRYTKSVALYETSSTKIPDEGAQVKVYLSTNPQFTTLATLFSDDDGTISLAQPFLTNTLAQQNPGQFTFVVDDGIYDIVVNENLGLTNQSVIASEKIFSQAVVPVLPDIDIDNIRYSKLQNPLLSVLKKNKLEDVIAGSLTWTRSTTATYVDRYGTIQTAAINEPRQEAAGWLIEGASENIAFPSEDFGSAQWMISGVTLISDSAISPDGSTTADVLTESLSNVDHVIFYNGSSETADVYTNYVYLEYVSAQFMSISTNGVLGTNWAAIVVDLINGTITDTASNGTYSIVSSSIHKIPNSNWLRCSITTNNTSDTVRGLRLRFSDSSNPSFNVSSHGSIVFTGTGRMVNIWGAQFENLLFASSYIPTVASSAPRDIEPVIPPADNNAPLFEDPFTVITKFTVNNLTHDDLRTIAHISSGLLVSNGTSVYIETNGNLSVYLRGTLTATSTAVTPGVEMSIALSYDGTDAQLYVNGVEVSETILVGAETGKPLRIGVGTQNLGVARSLFGNINTFKISDTPINADEAKFIS